MDPLTPIDELLKAALGGAAGGTLTTTGVIVLVLRRWVGKVEGRIDKLTEAQTAQLTINALMQERQSNLMGAMEILRKSNEATAKTVATLAASVQKMWLVMQAKGVVDPRHSDVVLKDVGKG